MFYLLQEIRINSNDGGEKKGLAFMNNNGFILDKQSSLDIIKRLSLFYNDSNVDEWINEENKKNHFHQYNFKYDDENEVYLLNEPTYELRVPKLKTGRSWGFTCKLCGNKWSSIDNDYYYRAYFYIDGYRKDGETVCSEECARQASLEAQRNWINERGFNNFFKRSIQKTSL